MAGFSNAKNGVLDWPNGAKKIVHRMTGIWTGRWFFGAVQYSSHPDARRVCEAAEPMNAEDLTRQVQRTLCRVYGDIFTPDVYRAEALAIVHALALDGRNITVNKLPAGGEGDSP